MRRSGGIGQLLKGIIMGIVLILAIIGSMSMLSKDDSNGANKSPPAVEPADSSSVTNTTPEIKAPEINIASQETAEPKPAENESETKTDSFQPTLEGEKPEVEEKEDEKPEPVKYGILKLTTINPENKENLAADYVVFDNDNTKIRESNNSSSASYRLATGTYRVVTTLVKSTDTTARDTAPIQSTKTITITAHKLNDVIVELEPPPTIGVLQVSATNAKNNQALKANFIIQKENGETVASRQNVTNSLFKLKAGSYKVTVKSGSNSDFRTIVVEPGESITEVFKLQEAFTQGKLLVRIIGIQSNTPVRADIEISSADGKIVQALKLVSQTEIALIAGNYKIEVAGSRGESSKNITIVAGQPSNQIFRIDSPTTTESVQINDDVKITGTDETKPAEETVKSTDINPDQNTVQKDEPVKSILKLFARNAVDQKPLKSNFYVQTPNGKNISKKIYADSAEFNLLPGKYKITIRSKNRKNIVRNIQVSEKQAITEVFSLQSNIPNATTTTAPNRELAPPKPAKSPTAIPNGFLNVAMQPARNTHFIIANRQGKKVVELTSVPSGSFKLDTGVYVVTAILNGQRRKQTIQVHQGKTARLNFNANDFQNKAATNNPNNNSAAVKKGKLRSRIVDNTGRPLKGNLTVANARGQVVARANNVTFGVFDLPATPHTVSVNYQGLSGSERVNISAVKTTVQTFTISPNNTRSTPQTPAPVQQPRDANDVLRDKLKEELRRIF